MPQCACASEAYSSVCVDCYSCTRINKVQVRVSIGMFSWILFVDLQNNASFSNYAQFCLLATISEEGVAKLVHRVLLLYLVVSSALERQLLVAARVRRELQGSADLQPLILDLNFWHRSFLTTIMVDHYPLFEFACSKIIIDKIFISIKADLAISSFMLYSFGISTEASAPTVLSFFWHL